MFGHRGDLHKQILQLTLAREIFCATFVDVLISIGVKLALSHTSNLSVDRLGENHSILSLQVRRILFDDELERLTSGNHQSTTKGLRK